MLSCRSVLCSKGLPKRNAANCRTQPCDRRILQAKAYTTIAVEVGQVGQSALTDGGEGLGGGGEGGSGGGGEGGSGGGGEGGCGGGGLGGGGKGGSGGGGEGGLGGGGEGGDGGGGLGGCSTIQGSVPVRTMVWLRTCQM